MGIVNFMFCMQEIHNFNSDSTYTSTTNVTRSPMPLCSTVWCGTTFEAPPLHNSLKPMTNAEANKNKKFRTFQKLPLLTFEAEYVHRVLKKNCAKFLQSEFHTISINFSHFLYRQNGRWQNGWNLMISIHFLPHQTWIRWGEKWWCHKCRASGLK